MGYRNRKLISSFGKDTKSVLDFAKQAKRLCLRAQGESNKGLHPFKAQRSRREQLDLDFHQRRDKKITARQSLASAFLSSLIVMKLPPQRANEWFLFVSSLLFVLQTLTGGLIAHYRAEPGGIFRY
jgi:hypothetical protein